MEILALIPARSGSKSITDKNISDVAGKPMLVWSVEHALQSRYVNRTVLSTDSEKYAQIGRAAGAEVPFLRPAEFATDTATDLQVFTHALQYLAEHEDYHPDIVVHLRPTYPKRDPGDIDTMIEMLMNDPTADCVRSLAPAQEIPYKMWLDGENGAIVPLIKDIPECYNMPRQQLPKVWYQNACIDVLRADTVLKKHSMTGDRILGFKMTENLDIDSENELLRARAAMLEEDKNQ